MDSSGTRAGDVLPDAVILDSMGVALLAVDPACRIIRFNGPAARLTGHDGEAVIGCPCHEVLQVSLCHNRCPVQEAMHSGTTSLYRTGVLQTRDRRSVTVEINASALLDGDGHVVGGVGILRDVTEASGLVRIYGSRDFVSRTPAMRQIFDSLPKLAASRAPLLIVGGKGSGRSALAETVHNLGSAGEARPLVHIACDSDGAETRVAQVLGDHRVPGYTPSAPPVRGGTLLLEGIGEASAGLQQLLLARLEQEEDDLGYRLISTATGRLETGVAQGSFRRDLFYRLDVLHVALPDLRERAEDIPLLVQQFVEELGVRSGREIRGVSAEAMQQLMEAEFPGNVRQLRTVIEQAHRTCQGETIEVADLPRLQIPWRERKASLEIETIKAALKRAEGNITRAARALQMHRTTLWRKLKRYGLKR